MKVTKKQIKAMDNLIAMSYVENEKRKMPIGECESEVGYEIMSGYMGVIYPEAIPELRKGDRQNTVIYNLIRTQLTKGYYYAVNTPFDGTAIQVSKIGKIIDENKISKGKQRDCIDLSATERTEGYFSPTFSELKGRFNAKYVKWAIEMCGKNVVCYLGYTDHRQYPYLYVNSGTTNLYEGIHVIVLPCRILS